MKRQQRLTEYVFHASLAAQLQHTQGNDRTGSLMSTAALCTAYQHAHAGAGDDLN